MEFFKAKKAKETAAASREATRRANESYVYKEIREQSMRGAFEVGISSSKIDLQLEQKLISDGYKVVRDINQGLVAVSWE